LREELTREVSQKIIDYRIDEDLEERLERMVEIVASADTVHDAINKLVLATVEHVALPKIDTAVATSLSTKLDQISGESLSKLIKRVTDDQLKEINASLTRLSNDLSSDKLYQYGVAPFLQAVFSQGGGTNGNEATNFPNGKAYYLDAQIPSGAEVVEAWAVPYQQANDVAAFYQYAVEKDPENSRQIVLRVSAAPPLLQRSANLLLRVYVLYRRKFALVN
jgi:hypothetical protein